MAVDVLTEIVINRLETKLPVMQPTQPTRLSGT